MVMELFAIRDKIRFKFCNFCLALSLLLLVVNWKPNNRMVVDGTVLQPFVDVKGNGALRDVRIMYDLYEDGSTGSSLESDKSLSSSSTSSQSSSSSSGSSSLSSLDNDQRHNEAIIDSKSSSFPYFYPHYHHHHTWQNTFVDPSLPYPGSSSSITSPSSSALSSGPHHPNVAQAYPPQPPYLQSSQSWPAPFYIRSPSTFVDHFKLKNVRAHPLIRGRPMFAEIDFVPKYIPQNTHYMAISVTLPAHIRGRSWILGWHQEIFPIPMCRLCTNNRQSFTLPVTLFLPDDGWCPEGRVPTIWKVEAISRETTARLMDQSDMTVAYGYDQLRQIYIGNDPNTTVHCRGINEAIVP